MSTPLARVDGIAHTAPKTDRTEKLHHAAKELESLFVKQLLTAAKMGGEAKGGYAEMSIDALASGVEKAGGLGLAQRIEQALSPSALHVAHTPATAGHVALNPAAQTPAAAVTLGVAAAHATLKGEGPAAAPKGFAPAAVSAYLRQGH